MKLLNKMLAVIDDVNQRLVEREELVETIALALLSRKNLFILGDPGQAKSFAVNCFCSHITGARMFERLLSKQTDEEQLFGRIDLSSLIPGGVPEVYLRDDLVYRGLQAKLGAAMANLAQKPDDENVAAELQLLTERLELYRKAMGAMHSAEPLVQTTGKLPEADICFLDEIFKCNDGVLNSLLTALNERKYTNEGRTYPIPTISFFAASNEIPNFNDPQEKILAALYDRLELKVHTLNITERTSRLSMLLAKQRGTAAAPAVSVTLEELKDMQLEVAAIPVPAAVNELADDILCALRKDIPISDRKILNYYPIAQAKAWLSGHSEVRPEDLLALKNYLWSQPTEISMVEATLNRMCMNPMQDKINDIRAVYKEVLEDLNAAKSQGVESRKAFRKFREELLRVYKLYTDLEAKAANDNEKAMLSELLTELENSSRAEHEKNGYTYATMKELSELH